MFDRDMLDGVRSAVDRDRLVDTAIRLIEVRSRTGEAGAVADRLAEVLSADGFPIERPAAGHPAAPAVVCRLVGPLPGPTLQFNGHLDTVHLPFVPPSIDGPLLRGSGASDMKGGVAAMIEALRAVRDLGGPPAGSLLVTAHDLHEAPWGLGEQLDQLIRDGVHGDAVLIPEPLCDHLPTVGRGSATWKATIRRPGLPVHEVARPDEPNVIAAGADLVRRLLELDEALGDHTDADAGRASLFIGQIHAGEIYNQYPQECWLEGTRRWLPNQDPSVAEGELRAVIQRCADDWKLQNVVDYRLIRHAFRLNWEHPIVEMFQACQTSISGRVLPQGPKAFVDDGNSFWRLADVPAITHGARAGGQHTLAEWVEIDDLVRVAQVYAWTAMNYCSPNGC